MQGESAADAVTGPEQRFIIMDDDCALLSLPRSKAGLPLFPVPPCADCTKLTVQVPEHLGHGAE